MVTVTESAKEELKKTLESAEPGGGAVGLRLVQSGPGQLGLVLDEEREGDQVVEHEGSKVLLVDTEVAVLVEGAIIDCTETAEGPRLVFKKEEV